MDVEVNVKELLPNYWKKGPDPKPNNPDYPKNYGSSWRSAHFPTTLAPVLYGKPTTNEVQQIEGVPRRHSARFNHEAVEWFRDSLARMYKKATGEEVDTVDTFTFIRAELLLFDRYQNGKTFGQFVLFTEVESSRIGLVQDVFEIITRREIHTSPTRSHVPGAMLYDYLDSEIFKVAPGQEQGQSSIAGLTKGIYFYDNDTYLRDTEAKIYSALHLRIDEKECNEIVADVTRGGLSQKDELNIDQWKVIQIYLAANLRLDMIIEDEEIHRRYSDKITTIAQGRTSLVTRLGASFLTLNDVKAYTRNSELYFYADHVDALMIGRLQDQILRHAEVDLVNAMGATSNKGNFDAITTELMTIHHNFIADSIRYWMDDVTANSGLGLVTLSKFKSAIGYQQRFDAMRTKIEDISSLSLQDQQNDLTERQEKFATILSIIGFIAIPLPLMNDGFAIVRSILNGEEYDLLFFFHFIGWLLMAVFILGAITWLLYVLLAKTGMLERLGISPFQVSKSSRGKR